MKKLIPVLLIVLLALSGCMGGNNSVEKGTVSLAIDKDLGVKTIEPGIDMTIASYSIYGTGPNGATFNESDITGSNAKFALALGQWTIVVDAYNEDNQNIAAGVATTNIVRGENDVYVTVIPLSGTGALNLDMEWTPNAVTKPVISGTLTPKSGPALTLPFTIASNNYKANYTNTAVKTGYHVLLLKLFDDDEFQWGALEAVRIIKESETYHKFTIDITGEATLHIDPKLQNPIKITLAGQKDNIQVGSSMTITATTSEPVDSYQWYLNADPISGKTTSSITIGSDLPLGTYRLDLLVSKGEIFSSESHIFRVTQNGPTIPPTPTAAPIPTIGEQSKNIAAGGFHSLALKNDGRVWAWGYNNCGQLGNGNTNSGSVPFVVNNLTNVIAIAAGYNHSLALKNDGTVWAWGNNEHGELGIGTTTNTAVPVQVTGLTNVVAIEAGAYHNIALRQDGSVWTWGYNNYGQLGINSTANIYIPVRISSLSNVKAIAAGYYHCLALTNGGAVFSWGYNAQGQLGVGSTSNWTYPVQLNSISSVKAISTGSNHSLAVKTDNTLWVWGYNGYGQLGNGTTSNKLTPIRVSSLSNIVAFAGGVHYTLAALSNGTVWAWGLNDYGQLGLGPNPSLYTPVPSGFISDVIILNGGCGHSLAVKNDGTVWSWGRNDYGQLGDGTNADKSMPVQISGVDLF